MRTQGRMPPLSDLFADRLLTPPGSEDPVGLRYESVGISPASPWCPSYRKATDSARFEAVTTWFRGARYCIPSGVLIEEGTRSTQALSDRSRG